MIRTGGKAESSSACVGILVTSAFLVMVAASASVAQANAAPAATSLAEPGPWAALRNTQTVFAIAAAFVAGILGGLLSLVVSMWRGVGWAIFTTLESGDGRTRFMKVVFNELESAAGQEQLSRIVLDRFRSRGRDDVRDLIIEALETSPPAQERLNRVVLNYSRDKDAEKFQNLILEMLEASPARERLAELVAKLVTTSEVSKQIVERGVRQIKPKASTADEADLRASELGRLGENPLANMDEIARMFGAVFQRLRLPSAEPPSPEAPNSEPPKPARPSSPKRSKPRKQG